MKFTSEIIIGLEIHVETSTKSKMFCGCERAGTEDEGPNTRTCEVCLGMPGSKPALNKKALEYGLKICLALNCKISPHILFSRKSYFYPDMAKNYQISQYETPLGVNGKLVLSSGKEVRIKEVHMEEDPAALVHPAGMEQSSFVLVDYNRSGDPLVEIVTEPDMESPDEARDFMKQLISILNYLKVFDVKTCIIKADVNISIKESGYARAEIKNVTGFKEIERALKYEVNRQKNEVKDGKKLRQETRSWDATAGITKFLRTKETEEDYGYIVDPDLTLIEIDDAWTEKIKKTMPELAKEKAERFVKDYKLKKDDAFVLAADPLLADIFEKVAKEIDPILAAKWLRRELVRVLNYNKIELEEMLIDENHIIQLLKLVETKKITETTAQKILEKLIVKPFNIDEYVKHEKLEAVSDEHGLKQICKEVIHENPSAVEDYKKGVEKSFNFLVGKVMAKTKGKAEPSVVGRILKELLK